MKFHCTMTAAGLLSICMGTAASQIVTKPAISAAPAPTESPAAAPTPLPAPVSIQAATAGSGAVVGITSTYVIGPEDALQVVVWKEPSLSGTFPVRPDGMISMALVGDTLAAGRTPMDLANDLTVRLRRFVNEPTVTVAVLAVNSKHIYMLGEVLHIGAFPLTSTLTPLQAISAAGGLSPYANKSHIYILRVDASGKKTKIPFNYKRAIKDGDLQGVTLLPGDTIVVP